LIDDSTYLHIESPKSDISLIRAYYGGIAYATKGATFRLTNNVNIFKCQAYEGVVAFLTDRARLILSNNVLINFNTANK